MFFAPVSLGLTLIGWHDDLRYAGSWKPVFRELAAPFTWWLARFSFAFGAAFRTTLLHEANVAR